MPFSKPWKSYFLVAGCRVRSARAQRELMPWRPAGRTWSSRGASTPGRTP